MYYFVYSEDCPSAAENGEDSVCTSGVNDVEDCKVDSRNKDICINNSNTSSVSNCNGILSGDNNGITTGNKSRLSVGSDSVDFSAVNGKVNCDKGKTDKKEPNCDINVSAWMENGLVSFDSDVDDYSEGLSGHSSTDTIVPVSS